MNPPLSVFVESLDYVGPALIFEFDGGNALYVDDTGQLHRGPIAEIKVDVRYDWNSHEWVDVNGVTEDAQEEPAPDGGEEVP